MKPDLFAIYPDRRIMNNFFSKCVLEWIIFNDTERTSEMILAFEEQYKDIGRKVCKVLSRTVCGMGQL
jgi:hypothetical protein